MVATPVQLIQWIAIQHEDHIDKTTSPCKKNELVLPSGSNIGKACSVKISCGRTNRVNIKSVVTDMVLKGNMTTVLANKGNIVRVQAKIYIRMHLVAM